MTSPEIKEKINPGLSAVLSFIFSGLGQLYNGQIAKGLRIMTFSTVGTIFLIIGAIHIAIFLTASELYSLLLGGIIFALGVIITSVIGVYNIYDAYNTAKNKLEGNNE